MSPARGLCLSGLPTGAPLPPPRRGGGARSPRQQPAGRRQFGAPSVFFTPCRCEQAPLGLLAAALILAREGALPQPLPAGAASGGRVYGLSAKQWGCVAALLPLGYLLGSFFGQLVALSPPDEAALDAPYAPRGEWEADAAASDPEPLPSDPVLRGYFGWAGDAREAGAQWGGSAGLLLGAFGSFSLLLALLEPGVHDTGTPGVLERRKLRRKLRAGLSVFAGQPGVALVNSLSAASLAAAAVYFLSSALAWSLAQPPSAAAPPCSFGGGVAGAVERAANGSASGGECAPLPLSCEAPPLWMRRTLDQSVADAIAELPLPSAPARGAHASALSGSGAAASVVLAGERLLSHRGGSIQTRICWRDGVARS